MNLKVTLQVPVYMEMLNHKICFEYFLCDRILMQCILFGKTRENPVCDSRKNWRYELDLFLSGNMMGVC